MAIQFDRIDIITRDCADIWNITGVDNEAIAAEVFSYVGQVMSNDPTQTRSEDSIIDLTAPATKILYEEINKVLKYRNLKSILTQQWGQIHRQYESSEMHEHTPYDVGWVYYARVPKDSGALVFTQFLGWTGKVDYVHLPKVGQLVMFPGWMVHRVTKNFNTIPRVSISGNANYIQHTE